MNIQSRIPKSSIEPLEARIAPAVILSASTVTFTDLDGDHVTIKCSKPVLNQGGVLTFLNSIDSDTNQLQLVSLGLAAQGAQLSITAVTPKGGFGDGFVNVGAIDASGVDLSSVFVKGDLGKILAGSGTAGVTALGKITVGSLGRLGTSTQNAGVDVTSIIQGNVGSILVRGDINEAAFDVVGSLKTLTVLGSIIGGVTMQSGEIDVSGAIGIAKILGNITGSDSYKTGRITADSIGKLLVGGSIYGGDGDRSGEIHTDKSIGSALIKGDIRGGSGKQSGRIDSNKSIGSMVLTGSLIGTKHDDTGQIVAQNDIGSLKIGGSIIGGGADSNTLAVNIANTGYVQADHIGSVLIGGSIIAGVNDSMTCVLTNSGAVRTSDDIGSIKVLGSLVGNVSKVSSQVTYAIIAGEDNSLHDNSPTSDVAIGSVYIGGSSIYGLILAGYDTSGAAVDGDAKIGTVVCKGDWTSGSIVAGIQSSTRFFGDLSDVAIPVGFPDNFSRIGSIIIGGQVYGTVGGSDVFAFEAESIGTIKIGGTTMPLSSGTDSFQISAYTGSDVRIREVA